MLRHHVPQIDAALTE